MTDIGDSGLHQGDHLMRGSSSSEGPDFAGADGKKLARVLYPPDSQEAVPKRGPQEVDLELRSDNIAFGGCLCQRCTLKLATIRF